MSDERWLLVEDGHGCCAFMKREANSRLSLLPTDRVVAAGTYEAMRAAARLLRGPI